MDISIFLQYLSMFLKNIYYNTIDIKQCKIGARGWLKGAVKSLYTYMYTCIVQPSTCKAKAPPAPRPIATVCVLQVLVE